ncbi:MAG: bifunctional (p)ppGpp synthetase/guanosine-3',5'-bis(diphosphate) 3'-pyrophosphohydrolase [Nevskiaceae bacterium]|nr:MAG: bifunctional (p)ppGpp synthetase/guanosine-3',5'-bis(diphosphate) 3'-pyrophosphohydrolase [Nevskiaceae bacterium]TBR72019.1 MAG: bifunctional (p)ppGpp synthetase/guanosine-3',5'-bis(diphosphate) 3'-pyrophosphohydrolase [Nevskiaceae bacterium]
MELPLVQRIGTAIHTQRVAREYGIEALIKVLTEYLPTEQIAEVRRAYEFGARMHAGQNRTSGEPYIYHPLAVARVLAEMRLDGQTIEAAILHDVIEDTAVDKAQIAAQFGASVADLVEGVSKFHRVEGMTRAERQAESVRKLLLAMAQDLRVILIKLADRLHNMRTLDAVEPSKRRRVARETLEIYAPIAQRLGINTVRTELEDLAFRNLHPHRYEVFERAVRQQLGDTRGLIREIERQLLGALKAEGLAVAVSGRQKNLYSIYEKMLRKRRRFLDVGDLLGFRVVVDKVDDCYRALGVVHHVYRPVSELFNDFIANPKINGYQSLHTTCVGPQGRKIEVQIRTREMHYIAESGIAAHWEYKLGKNGVDDQAGAPQRRASEWLTALFQLQDNDAALDFIDNVKVDLFPDEVYVFTPKGEIRRLPRGATPVDFAYAVHTDLGHRCVAARVDRQLESLSFPLSNGQTVEIITARGAHPNAAWLNFAKTAKARSQIRDYLKNQRVDQAIRLGRRLLETSLRELSVPLSALKGRGPEKVLAGYDLPDLDALYASIGSGRRLAPLVARQFLPDPEAAVDGRSVPLAVEGTEGLVVDYARCCYPVPGDGICGYVSVGRGIVVHRLECHHAAGRKAGPNAQDRIPLIWAPHVKGDFRAELRIKAENRRGLLGQVATEIAHAESGIENVQMPEHGGQGTTEMRFVVTVRDRVHLARVIRRLRHIGAVQRVYRTGLAS